MTGTTAEDVAAHRQAGPWRALATAATAMVADAESRAGISMAPLLGGGTRLMLALDHRISDDIDLFIRDPQWIGFLSPRLNDRFEAVIKGYEEDATCLKLRMDGGEIDFIVGMSLLGLPDEASPDTGFRLEPLAEVLAKKLFYRGYKLAPRDLFDWWCIGHKAPDSVDQGAMARLLAGKFDEIEAVLPLMVDQKSAGAWALIRAPDRPDIRDAIAWAQSQLAQWRGLFSQASTR